jgi:hypothetical protein
MKFHRLSEAQFHEMHEEFSVFLASNCIDKKKWERIKSELPEKVTFLLDKFSDLVWEKILNQCNYLEFSTPSQLFLFHTKKNSVDALVVKSVDIVQDLSTPIGFQWMLKNISSDYISLFNASKIYTPNRTEFIYSYLKKGAVLSDGQYFKHLKSYFPNSIK